MEMVFGLALLIALAIPLHIAIPAVHPHDGSPLAASLFRAMGVGLSAIVTATLVGLYTGLYRPTTVVVFLVVSTSVLALVLQMARRTDSAMETRSRYRSARELLAPVLIATIVLAWCSWTEPWNFLVATSMDAGNYEVYGNFWARSGSLYMQMATFADSVDVQGLFRGSNTWILRDDWSSARPSYLYGFPALLAVSASLSGTPGPSWIVMALLAAMNSWGLFQLGKRFSLPTSVAAAATMLAIVTPVFAFYSKQIMSEPMALLGILLLLFGLVGAGEDERPDPWFLASGLILALTSKIDALLVVLLLLASFATMAASGLWPTRTRPTWQWGLAGAVATAGAGGANLLMVDPHYLGKSTIAGRVPPLEGIPLMETPLYGVLIAGAAVTWLAIPLLVTRSRPHIGIGSALSRATTSPMMAVIRVAAGLGWLAFVYWLYVIRPRGATLEVGDHDALNAVRLVDVHSEAGIVLIAALPILWLILQKNEQPLLAIAVPLLAGLTYFVLRSNHNPAELWWMRRYLVMLGPLTVLAVAAMFRIVSERRSSSMSQPGGVVFAGVLAILVAMQIPSVSAQRSHVQNPSAPRVARELASQLDASDVLFIRSESRIVRGVAMSGAALVGTRVIPHMKDLQRWEDIGEVRGRRLLVTDRVLEPSACSCDPMLILAGQGEAQWASWQLAFRREPRTYLRTAPFWLYGLEDGR